MRNIRALAFAALLAMAGPALAQLKPSGPDTPPLPPTSAEVKQRETQSAMELAAQKAAEQWLALLDAGEYGRAWDRTAGPFRDRVPRERWVDALPKDRGAHGAVRSRRVELASYKPTLPGVPDGDYVTVRFATAFERKADAAELITLVLENGVWRPIGYGIQ